MSDENIIPFKPRLKPDDQPSEECRWTDHEGVEWFKFCVDFQFGGSEWSVDIWARNAEDAEGRVAALRSTAKLGGQLFDAIPWDGHVIE